MIQNLESMHHLSRIALLFIKTTCPSYIKPFSDSSHLLDTHCCVCVLIHFTTVPCINPPLQFWHLSHPQSRGQFPLNTWRRDILCKSTSDKRMSRSSFSCKPCSFPSRSDLCAISLADTAQCLVGRHNRSSHRSGSSPSAGSASQLPRLRPPHLISSRCPSHSRPIRLRL